MKSIIQIFTTILLTVVICSSCTKNEIHYGEFEKVTPDQVMLKVNYNIAYAANPFVQIKINGARVSALIQTRYPYPGGGYGTLGDSRPDYLVTKPGNQEVSISIPKKGTNIDSVLLYKTSIAVEAGKAYTLHLTDTAATTSSLLALDDFTLPDSGAVRYKFVNLMPNVPSVDLYYGTTLMASGIGYLKESDYFTMKIPAGTVLAWTVRTAGGTTALATYSSVSTVLNRRIYTIFATGYTGRTDNVRKPYLAFFLTR
ncbi:protein of unknown function [Pedobacter sp. ok626]|uniref:DUF4397 domain-containing protein n=1 Tax=Pedobacter sp. ok626 TaxID=1761882 RepID=UPI0008805938|nr:DUF4397 domain-containing protein [Pedobacter sp. ok626]SDL48526.1 protein of unknown function [Pedobacter sp. ok626]